MPLFFLGSLMTTKHPILVGAHVSIAGDLANSIKNAIELGANTMQIFTKSNRSWFAKQLTKEEIDRFKQAIKKSGIIKPVVHASYLINLAAQNPLVEKNSVRSLTDELKRCEALDIPYLVLHPGSHVGAGEEVGIQQIAKNLDLVLEQANGTTTIALEIMAGQGTNLGYTFTQLKQMIDLTKHHKHLGICLDTCHAFAAGYDISTEDGYNNMMTELEKTIGIGALKVIHLNDSQDVCNARKDRHECIGKGKIPLSTFKLIMQDKRLIDVPKILETPNPTIYAEEIELLRQMAG